MSAYTTPDGITVTRSRPDSERWDHSIELSHPASSLAPVELVSGGEAVYDRVLSRMLARFRAHLLLRSIAGLIAKEMPT